MDRPGHFGGAMLLFFGIMYFLPRGDTLQTLSLSVTAAGIAAAMSMKPDMDKKFFFGVFHRCWVTHSLLTVIMATAGTFVLFSYMLNMGLLSYYAALAVFCAIGSHVLLDSFTRMGVPLYGPFDNKMRGPRWFRGSNPLVNYTLLAAGGLMMLFYYKVI
ncbi:metal-dependent hydrolase [Methanocella conradii]|uniref:metal-dependent hydrolase n=1 Tax=Methanocella conradii TaxID=1175444 RepID=UPI0024B35D12|nr:metal-dependent hydrolase [Methanocella conradii]MDI6896802.1 metal-dependent hydrolase [Methanocella conradii]